MENRFRQMAELQTAMEELQVCLDGLRQKVQDHINPYEVAKEAFDRSYALSFEELRQLLPEVTVKKQDFARGQYERFLEKHLPWHGKIAKRADHKKKLELFLTFSLLGSRVFQTYMDAAGGGFSYAGTIDSKQSILQDIEIRQAVKNRSGKRVKYVESSISKIPVKDGSVDAISSHHSFEHFQGYTDVDFIKEVQRILAPNGMMAIVPLFLAKNAIEMTNRLDFLNWSIGEESRVFDQNATLPGKKSRNFARIYSVETFRDRVLSAIDLGRFKLELIEATLEGRPIPDPVVYKDHKVSNFNYPYRVFTIQKLP